MSKSSVIQFADDTTLYKSGNSNKTLFNDINEDLKQLSTWFRSNTLSLNAAKTNFILFRSARKKFNDEFSLSIDGTVIKRCSFTKFLGMYFDEFLSWDKHVKYIGKKLSSCLYSLNSLKRQVDLNVLKKIYFSLFDTHLRYGLHLWANTSVSNTNYIFKLQKKAIRILCNANYNAHTAELFVKLKLLNINQMIEKAFATVSFRFTHNSLPPNVKSLFSSNTEVHSYQTRQRSHPHIFKHRSQLFARSFLHRATMIWQSLPYNIRTCNSVKLFNRQINNHLLA